MSLNVPIFEWAKASLSLSGLQKLQRVHSHKANRQVNRNICDSCYFNIISAIAAAADIHFKSLLHSMVDWGLMTFLINEYAKDRIWLALKSQFNTLGFFSTFECICKLVRRDAKPRRHVREFTSNYIYFCWRLCEYLHWENDFLWVCALCAVMRA